MAIRPGTYAGDSLVADDKHVIKRNVTTVDTLLDLIRYDLHLLKKTQYLISQNLIVFRNLFPPNLVQAALQQVILRIIFPHV